MEAMFEFLKNEMNSYLKDVSDLNWKNNAKHKLCLLATETKVLENSTCRSLKSFKLCGFDLGIRPLK
jgi:hypothetical protein